MDGTPHLFKTEPSGVFFEYLASSIGRSEKQVKEYLEDHYKDGTIATEDSVLKLVIESLSQVVQSGAQNIEIAVITYDQNETSHCKQRLLTVEEVEKILKEIEETRAAAQAEEASARR